VKLAWVKADNIHRNRSQNARQRALKALKTWDIKVLVATDIASRWLDVSWLALVINYNLPKEAETYVHRIWRTGRAWEKWTAISFCIEAEKEKLQNIEKLIWKKIDVLTDEKYKQEKISNTKILGYSNFDENWKEKYKKKTRKSTWKKRYYKTKKR
jgi:ATP-dependent RNA helicase RhlE